jgi:class 3 adenylate cyclase
MDIMREGRMATLTVLVCDLVGSTQQRAALGDDAADRLAVVLDRVLRGAVARHHGSVVKSTGDGLMAVFDSASDALAAAVVIQQETERWNRRVPEPEHLVLRIGASAGDVQFVAHDVHGTPVIEAARLEAVAEPGSILVTTLVRMLVGNRGANRLEAAGSLDLKGFAEPLEVFSVRWDPLPDDDDPASSMLVPDEIPLPARLAFRPSIGVIEYEPQLAAIDRAVRRVSSGQGRELLLLTGEPGEGKTTIAAEGARMAFAAGACVLFGHCEESFTAPYQLFAEALGHYVEHASEERLREHVARYGSELVRIVPGLAHRLPDLPPSRATDADTERYLLFAAIAGLLSAEAERRLVVLVFDDLQWADAGSLQLLCHLAGENLTTKLLVIAAFRDTELPGAAGLREALGAFRRSGGVERLDLRGFDHAGVVACIEALAGYALVGDEMSLADAVYRETDGNPFYVIQILRHLVDTHAIEQDSSGRWVAKGSFATVALPDSVREVIGGQVAQLGGKVERMLDLAAVIGRDFEAELLAQALTVDHDALIDMLDAAASGALVREATDRPGHYSFVHALIQHTLYEGLGPTRRAAAHRRVGEALEALSAGDPGPRIGELARHWTSATDRIDATRAVEYSRLAGDAALRALAPSDALRHYSDALRFWPSLPEPDPFLHLDLAIGLGSAQRQVGDADFRETLLDAALQAAALDDTDRLVSAALATHRGLFSNFGAIDDERVGVFDECLRRLASDDPRRALLLAAYCQELVVGTPLETRQRLADEAFAIATACGDDEVLVRVMVNTAYALIAPPMLETQLQRTAEGRVRAERLGDPVLEFFACNWRRGACAQAGELAEMNRCTERMAALSAAVDQPLLRWVHVFSLAWLAEIEGDPDEAERLATQALTIGTESGQPDAEFIFGGQFMMVNHQRGTLDTLSPLMEDMASATPNMAGVITGALAIADIEAGRTDAARSRLQRFADQGFELEMNPVWVSGMSFYAEAAIELGDPEFCAPLYERLRPWSAQWTDNGATAMCPVAHYLGGFAAVMGRDAEAEEWFARAVGMCDSMAARFFRVQTQVLWARMLIGCGASGDLARARELLTDAVEVATARGYGAVHERALTELRRIEGARTS